jgi:hypothetical protein
MQRMIAEGNDETRELFGLKKKDKWSKCNLRDGRYLRANKPTLLHCHAAQTFWPIVIPAQEAMVPRKTQAASHCPCETFVPNKLHLLHF